MDSNWGFLGKISWPLLFETKGIWWEGQMFPIPKMETIKRKRSKTDCKTWFVFPTGLRVHLSKQQVVEKEND